MRTYATVLASTALVVIQCVSPFNNRKYMLIQRHGSCHSHLPPRLDRTESTCMIFSKMIFLSHHPTIPTTTFSSNKPTLSNITPPPDPSLHSPLPHHHHTHPPPHNTHSHHHHPPLHRRRPRQSRNGSRKRRNGHLLVLPHPPTNRPRRPSLPPLHDCRTRRYQTSPPPLLRQWSYGWSRYIRWEGYGKVCDGTCVASVASSD